MRGPLLIDCQLYGRITSLSPNAQERILTELRLPAQATVIECACGRFQFILRAESNRSYTLKP
jgi:hypothetical protein